MITKEITYIRTFNNGKVGKVTKTVTVYTEDERDIITDRVNRERINYLERIRQERRALRLAELDALYGYDRSLEDAINEYVMNVRDFRY